MTAWRIFCAVVGLLGLLVGGAGVAYTLTPAFGLEPQPAFEASLAAVVLLIAGRFLVWGFAPDKLLRRRRPPRR